MLIHHFEADTQGFQRLVDQNDRGKAKVPKKSHFMKETFFEGVLAFPPISPKGHEYPNALQCIIKENIFVFDLPCIKPN